MANEAPGGIGVFTTDTDLIVRSWDAWLAAMTGLGVEDARGRALRDLVPELSARDLLSPFQRVLSTGAVEILAPAIHGYLIACAAPPDARLFDRMQQRVTIGPLRVDERVLGTIVAVEDVTLRIERERELAARLATGDPETRIRAAEGLAGLDPIAGTEPLFDALGDEDWRVRRTAVRALRRRSTAEVMEATVRALRHDHGNLSMLSSAIELLGACDYDVVEPLQALLREADPDLRVQAALVLGERGDGRAVGALLEALGDSDENVRFHAIEALGKLRAGEAVEPLAVLAESGDFFLAFPALEALAAIGDASVAARLVGLLRDDLLRGAAADALGRLGNEQAVAPLTALLNDASAPVTVVSRALVRVRARHDERFGDGEPVAQRVCETITAAGTQNLLDALPAAEADDLRALAEVLGWLQGPAVARALTRLLGQPSVRARVVEYLVRHGEGVVELLLEQLHAEDLDTRQAAVVALGRIGDRRATLPLLRLLETDPRLSVTTAGAFARIGDARAFEPLLDLLGHHEAQVRHAVVAALNSIGHPSMAGRVVPLLGDSRPEVRESAVRIAGYFGYPGCTDALLACCRDGDEAVRRAALGHAPFFDDDRIAPAVVAALDDPAPVVRAAAAQSLGQLETAGADQTLREALADPDAWVRYFAARGLARRRNTTSVTALARLATTDPAPHVRMAAVDGLGAIGDPEAIPTLATLLDLDDTELRHAVLRALGTIRHPDAWPLLRAGLRSDDEAARATAASSVAAHGGPAALEALEWLAAADDRPVVVAAAVGGLARLAADTSMGPPAVRALVGLTADPARAKVVIAGLAGLPAALVGELAGGLTDPRPAVRMAVVRALGRMRRPEASRLLLRALDDEAPQVRLTAVAELGGLGSRGLERKLVTLARSDGDAGVRRAALGLLRDRAPAAGVADDTGAGVPV